MRVLFHQRRPHPHQVSIEQVFDGVRGHLPPRVTSAVALDPEPSHGVMPRVKAVIAAGRTRRGADVHHMTGDTTFVTLALPRRRTVVTIHDCEILDRLSPAAGLVYRALWLQLPVSWAAVTTVVSPATADHLRRVLWRPPRDLRVVPNAVTDRIGGPRAEAATVAVATTGRPVVLAVGTAPNKGIERLAAATAGMDIDVRIVGALSNDQRSRLTTGRGPARLDERGQVPADLLLDAYAGVDVLVVASTREGFGLPILEAQTLGIPVICTDAAPLPWVAGPGGARLVPVGAVGATDDGSLRTAIEDVLADPALAATLVEAGRTNVARFSQAATAAAYLEIYDELATRR